MSKKNPFISVIIPTYNSKEFLKVCLEGLGKQDYKNFEVIVVDDGSTDNTLNALKEWKKKLKLKLKILKQKRNGPATARNLGIKHARGKIIAFTDADCLVPRNWLSTFLRYYKKYPNIAGIGGYLEPNANNLIAKLEKLKNKHLHGMQDEEILGRKNVPTGFTNNMSYKTQVLREFKGFNEKFKKPAGEDPELKNRIAEKYDLIYIPLKVKHLETYNLNYLLRQILKRGTEKKLKKTNNSYMVIEIIKNFPQIVNNLTKKSKRYKEIYKDKNESRNY